MIRVQQRDILPGAVKGRNIENIIFGTREETAQTTLNNGEEVVVLSTLTQDKGYELMGSYYVAIYVGSVAESNLLPGGSAIDESQWQVIGPQMAYDQWIANDSPRNKDYAKIYVRNISAGAAQTLLFKIKWRYLSPQEGSA